MDISLTDDAIIGAAIVGIPLLYAYFRERRERQSAMQAEIAKEIDAKIGGMLLDTFRNLHGLQREAEAAFGRLSATQTAIQQTATRVQSEVTSQRQMWDEQRQTALNSFHTDVQAMLFDAQQQIELLNEQAKQSIGEIEGVRQTASHAEVEIRQSSTVWWDYMQHMLKSLRREVAIAEGDLRLHVSAVTNLPMSIEQRADNDERLQIEREHLDVMKQRLSELEDIVDELEWIRPPVSVPNGERVVTE